MASQLPTDRVRHRVADDAPPDLLRPGDHLDQPTFHRLYEAMPEDFKAELIGGMVVVPVAVSANRAEGHGLLVTWLSLYAYSTPGVLSLNDATVILGPDSEPQPDGLLLIRPEYGGQTHREGNYIAGPPELVAEVAYSTYAHDLHSKRRDYERAGVREYMVLIDRQRRVEWFTLLDGAFEPHPLGADGVFRSSVFPGLWLDPTALVERDGPRLLQVLQQGLASPDHAEFVRRLDGHRPQPSDG